MKVYVGLDDFYQYFIWDKATLDLLSSDHLPLVEISDTLWDEYKEVSERMYQVQQRLKEYFHENLNSN